MKRLILVMVILTMFLNAQIFRYSESGIKQPKIEYTQGGILLRFDFKQVERIDMGDKSLMWEYQEFWIPLNMAIADIQKVIGTKGYKLAEEDIKMLTIGKMKEMLILLGADSTEIAEMTDENNISALWAIPAAVILGGLEAIRRWRAKRKVKNG